MNGTRRAVCIRKFKYTHQVSLYIYLDWQLRRRERERILLWENGTRASRSRRYTEKFTFSFRFTLLAV